MRGVGRVIFCFLVTELWGVWVVARVERCAGDEIWRLNPNDGRCYSRVELSRVESETV
jgi:hypothetical protein